MSRKPTPQPDSEALLHEWRSLMSIQYSGHSDGLGGTLGEQVARGVLRAKRISQIERELCERIYAEPTVEPGQ